MNQDLQKLFSLHYNDLMEWTSPEGYFARPTNLILLLQKYNINSMFDAGCGPRHWIADNRFTEYSIEYSGGDIALDNVKHCNRTWPDLDIQVHDMTTDPFPAVDLIFSSDVVIHLNNADKLKFLQNFLSSSAKYLLVTHSGDAPRVEKNLDVDYTAEFPFQPVNWYLDPWYFPQEIDCLTDPGYLPGEKRMCLWSKEQISSALA